MQAPVKVEQRGSGIKAVPVRLMDDWTGEQNFACDGKIFYGTAWQPVCTFVLINVLQGVLLGNTVKDIAEKYPQTKVLYFFGVCL